MKNRCFHFSYKITKLDVLERHECPRRNYYVGSKILATFQSPSAISRPRINGQERNVILICNSSLYTHCQTSSQYLRTERNKLVITNQLAKLQSPRAITRPNIIVPERNVNFICNSSVYTHMPKIKSIYPRITTQSCDNCFISEFYAPVTQWRRDHK